MGLLFKKRRKKTKKKRPEREFFHISYIQTCVKMHFVIYTPIVSPFSSCSLPNWAEKKKSLKCSIVSYNLYIKHLHMVVLKKEITIESKNTQILFQDNLIFISRHCFQAIKGQSGRSRCFDLLLFLAFPID